VIVAAFLARDRQPRTYCGLLTGGVERLGMRRGSRRREPCAARAASPSRRHREPERSRTGPCPDPGEDVPERPAASDAGLRRAGAAADEFVIERAEQAAAAPAAGACAPAATRARKPVQRRPRAPRRPSASPRSRTAPSPSPRQAGAGPARAMCAVVQAQAVRPAKTRPARDASVQRCAVVRRRQPRARSGATCARAARRTALGSRAGPPARPRERTK
jgi:hypothetical protein